MKKERTVYCHWLVTILVMGLLLWVLGFVLWFGLKSLSALDPQKLTSLFAGTLSILVVAFFIAAPLAFASSLYIFAFAKAQRRSMLLKLTEALAAVPPLIYGLVGAGVFVGGWELGTTWALALTLALMMLPQMQKSTFEALAKVPPILSQGSLALGASQVVTQFRLVLPQAWPGILGGMLRTAGRSLGESAAVVLVLGTMSQDQFLAAALFVNAFEGELFLATALAFCLLLTILFFYLLAALVERAGGSFYG